MESSAYLQQLDTRLEAAGFERIEPALPNLGSLRACRRETVVDNLTWTIVCVVLPGPPDLTVQGLRQTSFTVYDTVNSAFSRPLWSHLVVYPVVLMPTVSAELALEIRSACKPKSHWNGVELPVVVDL